MNSEELAKTDIVYFVKETPTNEELRYSLRTVEKNFPHRKGWIYGGAPFGIKTDELVRLAQTGDNKWDKVRNMFQMVCRNEEITENFVLFNDDFFIMKPVKSLQYMYRCSLEEHIDIVEQKFGNAPTNYTKQLRKLAAVLEENGLDTKSYELHLPIIFNRKKLQEMMHKFPSVHGTRTLYGNYYNVGGRKTADVKVFRRDQPFSKSSRFLSTDDLIFRDCPVGDYIREKFPDKSRFEE